MKCPVCFFETEKTIVVKERMLNEGATFPYLYCETCGTLHRLPIFEDIGKYYNNSYYSFKKAETFELHDSKKKIFLYLIKKRGKLSKILRNTGYNNSFFDNLFGTGITTQSAILDVGCGSGSWLEELYIRGCGRIPGPPVTVVH